MKKSIFVAIVMLFGIYEMNAQVTFTPGIRGGLNLSTITDTDGDYTPDFYLGIFGAVNFTKRYTLQSEINYSRQGADNVRVEYYDFDAGANIQRREKSQLNYISLSMINKFYLVKGFHIMVGPTFDIVTSDNLLYRNTDVDLGVNSGLGYKFPNGITVEARFKKGVVDVLSSEYYSDNNYFWGDYNTNNVFQFGVSYAFNLKGKK